LPSGKRAASLVKTAMDFGNCLIYEFEAVNMWGASPMDVPAKYDIHTDVKFRELELVDVGALRRENDKGWFNQTLCRVNDSVVRLGVVQGEFHWHSHANEDEFFYVVSGRLFVDIEGGPSVELEPEQGYTVPKGVVHRTRAPERTAMLMIASADVNPVGDQSGKDDVEAAETEAGRNSSTYDRLIGLLTSNNAEFKVIEHEPEGRTAVVSPMRGHATREAAKCIVLMVKANKKAEFLIVVVPGDARVDLERVKRLKRADFIRFAEQAVAERLTGCVAGTILPFALAEPLEILVDPAVAESPTMYFNAGRLDRSIALATKDYLRIASPRIERVALAAEA